MAIEDRHFHFHIDVPEPANVLRILNDLATHVTALEAQGVSMAGELDALKAQVAASKVVEASALILIRGIAARIDAAIAAGGNPAVFAQLSSDLKASADDLSAAVVDNTPVVVPDPEPPLAGRK